MRNASLYGSPPSDVLVDPAFAAVGGIANSFGAWLLLDGSGAAAHPTTASYSATPVGVSSLVAQVPSKPATSATGSSLELVAGFPGGTGGARASVWISKNGPDGEPVSYDQADAPIAVAVLGYAADTERGFDLTREEEATTVIEGRTWYRYGADVPGGLELEGFFKITIAKGTGNVWITAPSVVPRSLAALPETRAFASGRIGRSIRPDELRAIAAYRAAVPPLMLSPIVTRTLLSRP